MFIYYKQLHSLCSSHLLLPNSVWPVLISSSLANNTDIWPKLLPPSWHLHYCGPPFRVLTWRHHANKLCTLHSNMAMWTGCIQEQLVSLKRGFNLLIPHDKLEHFSPHELEVILSGQPVISIDFIKRRTVHHGYSQSSAVVQWLWEVLESFSQASDV